MKTFKLIISILISSLFVLNASFANIMSPNPESKLCTEITLKLDDAYSLNLEGQTVDATIVLLVDEDHRFHVVDSGTDNSQLDQYIREKLDHKKVWTRNVKTDCHYFLTVRFEPNR